MKTCCKCKIEKESAEFYANKRSKDGLNSFCIACHKADNIARKKANRADPEFRKVELEKKRKYNAKTSEHRKQYMKNWHSNNSDSQAEYRAKYRKENSEYFSNYAKENSGKLNAKTRKRQAAKLKRTPKWLDVVDLFQMECIYTYASSLRKIGLKYEVDHIYPLQGKLVSGLHIPSNLRVVHKSENRRKNNKFEVA